MSPQQITLAVTAIANLLAENLTSDELALFAALFAQLGDTLASIAVINDSQG